MTRPEHDTSSSPAPDDAAPVDAPAGIAPAEGIDLDDGTWVDAGPDGKWRPSAGERTRAVVILAVVLVALLTAALIASVDDGDGEPVAAATSTTTTTVATTTTTTEPPDPSSLDGEPVSARCRSDDRSALPLRDRQSATVLVLNGTYQNGYAGDTTEELEALGYTTVVPDNADRQETSIVAYKQGFCVEAERLADDLELSDARIEPVPDDLPVPVGRARLVVTLGLDSL